MSRTGCVRELPHLFRIKHHEIIRDKAVFEVQHAGRADPLAHLVLMGPEGKALHALFHHHAHRGLGGLFQVGVGIENGPVGDVTHGDEDLAAVHDVAALDLLGVAGDLALVLKVDLLDIGACAGSVMASAMRHGSPVFSPSATSLMTFFMTCALPAIMRPETPR